MPKKYVHPFEGGKVTKGITKKHRPLIWECMLGTVYARRAGDDVATYFDYKIEEARKFVDLARYTDLRICRNPDPFYRDQSYGPTCPKSKQLALWGIPLKD